MLSTDILSLPPDFPVQFPLNTHEDIQVLEHYLDSSEKQNRLSSYLSSLGGTITASRTNRILRKMLNNELANDYNFLGQRKNKRPFGTLKMKTVVLCAVHKQSSSSTDHDIENAIKIWLKHAHQRLTVEKKRKQQL
ncbi:uncharacterized protein LOC105185700 [Harpegnathos saltator]|uniref:uncharacterized protein LOC105185700 n=1 Tax=Harpegnathos saltator TaxID=610380 RepID=UPI000948DB1A|nr:uncharacterized protein LOC105185700 [Harpegnathos saltator]